MDENTLLNVRKPATSSEIISRYMTAVLESNHPPQNIYLFCKESDILETEFYASFGSFEGVKQEIWHSFIVNAMEAMTREPAYNSYTAKNKLLALYFTLFEILTLNRSYILFSIKDNREGLKNLKDLVLLRRTFKNYIVALIKSDTRTVQGEKAGRVTEPVFSQGAWVQFLVILKFWIDDNSKGFEKTDIFIEKSVNTVVDLLDTKPIENLIDLGKFLWKENKMR